VSRTFGLEPESKLTPRCSNWEAVGTFISLASLYTVTAILSISDLMEVVGRSERQADVEIAVFLLCCIMRLPAMYERKFGRVV